jgi:hypothetical protein
MSVGIFVAVCGALLLLGALRSLLRQRRLRGRAAGVITYVRVQHRDGPDHYFARVRFVLPDGREIEAETTMKVDGVQRGDRVEVSYDPDDPERMDLAGSARDAATLMFVAGSLILAAGAGVIVVAAI